jgi:hypothetical protein
MPDQNLDQPDETARLQAEAAINAALGAIDEAIDVLGNHPDVAVRARITRCLNHAATWLGEAADRFDR